MPEINVESQHQSDQDFQNIIIQGDDAISKSSIFLENLHIATEKLQIQNEELLASRHMLALERQRYKELFDFAPDGYLVTNSQGVIQQANPAASVMFNLHQPLIVGRPLLIFVEEIDQAFFHKQFEKIINSGHSLNNWEVNLKTREKPSFPVSISVSAIYYDYARILKGFCWILRDLSQQKQSEKNFREQTDLLNDSTDGILVRSLENQVLLWNQGAERLYGWTAAEALGQNISELLYGHLCEMMKEDPSQFPSSTQILPRKKDCNQRCFNVSA
jgi:two-component system, cell cycle sensor histidine kinase and response regulator CckA